MKTCALAPLNKADTFFGGNGGASSSQKCHHNYYTAAAVHSSLKCGKKGEKFEDVQKKKQKLNLNFLEYKLGLGTKNNFKKMWIILLVVLYHIT